MGNYAREKRVAAYIRKATIGAPHGKHTSIPDAGELETLPEFPEPIEGNWESSLLRCCMHASF
eukprot:4547101-Amphidinium_carterae.1